MARIDTLFDMIKERRLGFLWDEIMTGTHEFEPGCGPEGRHSMEFCVTWGSKRIHEYLDPRRHGFLKADLEGSVNIEGLCTDAPCRGRLDLKYFSERSIRYAFEFEASGTRYQYVGDKVNIWPWNLPVSHTTCFGTVKEADTGKLVSRSVLHFRLRRLPAFVASLRLA